jgi:hypothetical protein
MNHTKIFVYSILFLTILLFAKPVTSETTYNWKWSPDIQFKLPAYGTVIAFDDYIYMNSFVWDDNNATKITFNNVAMDGETLDSWTVSVQNANLTVNDLFVQQTFQATVTANTGTLTTTTISTGAYSNPQKVYVGSSEVGQVGYQFFSTATSNCRAYDDTNKNLYITGGTVSDIKVNGQTVFTATNCMVHLEPTDTFSITFSVAPTIITMGE